jgi:hypothetical protein
VQAESHIDIRERRHAILRQLFLNGAQKGPVCCPILFGVPTKGPYAQRRSKAAPQLLLVNFDEAVTELQKTSFRVSRAVVAEIRAKRSG